MSPTVALEPGAVEESPVVVLERQERVGKGLRESGKGGCKRTTKGKIDREMRTINRKKKEVQENKKGR
jgi:predicted flavoprotein YhiN